MRTEMLAPAWSFPLLNQQQFFDAGDYNVDPAKMNFNQFTQAADYYHGTVAHKSLSQEPGDWAPHEGMHAGTREAAEWRIQARGGGTLHGQIFPLQHVGKYEQLNVGPHGRDSIIGDRGSDWGGYGTVNTQKYHNDIEHQGSISVVGPAKNFRTYKQYVEAQARPTHQQHLEIGRGSREYVEQNEDKEPAEWKRENARGRAGQFMFPFIGR